MAARRRRPIRKSRKVDEKAYKAALERIPEPKEKYDPWGVAQAGRAGQEAEVTGSGVGNGSLRQFHR